MILNPGIVKLEVEQHKTIIKYTAVIKGYLESLNMPYTVNLIVIIWNKHMLTSYIIFHS